MNFVEHAGKRMLEENGLPVPSGILCSTVEEVETAAARLGPCVIKAQVATGKRGKAGGIKLSNTVPEARENAIGILGMEIDGLPVERVLVEEQVRFTSEFYLSIFNDAATKSPLILFSAAGGMDIEESAATAPELMRQMPVDIRKGISLPAVHELLEGLDLFGSEEHIVEFIADLYTAYRSSDAELIEINPLGLLEDGRVIALDCKFILDDQSAYRQESLAEGGTPERLTPLEQRASDLGLKYIELPGEVGILANGAGLTMTTMDAVTYYGGSPANFLEIGGDAYTKGRDALEIVLANPSVKSLLVNFCGAFARTDIMTQGLLEAWKELKPTIPVFFTIHGTGEEDAKKLVQGELEITPFDFMDDAVTAAVEAAA